MPSRAQISANRRNAIQSTGPRTLKGKTIASGNSQRHGLLAKNVILDGEDQQLFRDRVDSITQELDPLGGLEEMLVARVVKCEWRLHRIEQIEASLFRHEALEDEVRRARRRASTFIKTPLDDVIRITDTTEYAAAERQVEEAEALRDKELAAIAFIGANKNDALTKLARYETNIERRMYRALE